MPEPKSALCVLIGYEEGRPSTAFLISIRGESDYSSSTGNPEQNKLSLMKPIQFSCSVVSDCL